MAGYYDIYNVIKNLDDDTYLEDFENDIWTSDESEALRLDPVEAEDTLNYLQDDYDNVVIEQRFDNIECT